MVQNLGRIVKFMIMQVLIFHIEAEARPAVGYKGHIQNSMKKKQFGSKSGFKGGAGGCRKKAILYLDGGAKNFRLTSLATSHPPDQNSETAPGRQTPNLVSLLGLKKSLPPTYLLCPTNRKK